MNRRDIMRHAWSLCRMGAKKFGGKPGLYLVCAMRIAWREAKHPLSIWQQGTGNHYLLPGVELPKVKVGNSRYLLPGIGQ